MSASAVAHPPRGGFAWLRRRLTVLGFLFSPVGLLLLFFVAPMAIMLQVSFEHSSAYSLETGYTLDNYREILSNPLYRDVARDTLVIATAAMVVQFLLAVPLAYVMAFKAGRFELPLLLALVLADELNPIVRIYAWRELLGRQGLVNDALQWIGLIDKPLDWLLFSKFAVVTVLSTSWLTYTVIPIYAAMKAIDAGVFEAALDLGAGWFTTFRRILIPLAAPGVFVAVILVYIPLFSEFATPALVGGRSGYMLGSIANSLILEEGDWGAGAALNFLLLLASGLVSVLAYYLSKLNQIDR
ncbi:MAG TPA: ABC transporter permease [Gaiellales bacterium]|nr:ABC transporter permease [Gaiellales bacterium]